MEDAFSEVSFGELSVNSDIKRAIDEMGFEKMTPIQAQAIPALLTGRDVIGQAQTGTGKTAAFGIPILNMVDPKLKKLQAIILCPTRELAVQAAGEIRSFAKYMHDVKLLAVYGGQDISVQIRGLKGVQIIVGTPGRVMDHMRRHTIKLDDVKMVVLDEADEMLDMGFREDMELILGEIDNEHQTCLFSATMPQGILDITGNFQKDPEFIKITRKELTIDRIKQYYYPVKQEFKQLALVRLLKFYNYDKSIIFCNTKSMVDELVLMLQKEGLSADGLHGDLSQKQRDLVMGRFRNGQVKILIATDIAARGIDVDDVEAVFNFDIPQEIEYYVHRIGRTARAGKDGVSHTLCRSRDFGKIHDIEHVCHAEMEERRIPSVEEINSEKEKAVFEHLKELISCECDVKLIEAVSSFCDENEIEPEELAAALLSRELGEKAAEEDDIEINLPDKGHSRGRRYDNSDGKRTEHNDRRRRDDEKREGRDHRKHDDEKHEGRDRRRHDDEKHEGRDRRRHDDEHAGRKSRDFDGGKKNKGSNDKEKRTKIKRENRERSERILKKAAKDVRRDGSFKK